MTCSTTENLQGAAQHHTINSTPTNTNLLDVKCLAAAVGRLAEVKPIWAHAVGVGAIQHEGELTQPP